MLLNYGFIPAGFTIISLIVLFVLFSGRNHDASFTICVLSIFIIPALISIVQVVNLCKMLVAIDSEGIRIQTLFRNVKIKWSDVKEIKKVNIPTAGFHRGPPRDIRLLVNYTRKIWFFRKLVAA